MIDSPWGRAPRALRAAVAAVALGAAAPAALLLSPTAAEAQSFRFDRVQVEGNARVEASSIVAFAGIPGGRSVSAAEVNAGLQNVQATGLFETVEFEPRGNTLIIRVVEFPTINRIAIEGNRRLRDDRLLPLVQSQSRRVFDPAQAEADAAALTDAYRQSGRVSATVTPRIIRRADNRVDLVFEVAETRVVEIERLSFVGNRAFSDRRLRRVLNTKQAGFLRTLIQRDSLVEERLQFDRQLLRDFYLSRGYVDFEILSINSEITAERDAFLLTFNIREGQRFTLGEVGVTSEVPGVDPAAYAAELGVRRGAIYSPFTIDRTVARLEQLATRQGLDFVRVEPRITRNDRDLTLDVTFAIVRGPRIFVERIDVEGNQTTLDRVIRRQFDTVEGDPFNPRAIRASAERIRALGFFGDVSVDTRQGSAADRVIVDVDVAEAETGTLNFGGSYSPGSGFGFSLGFSERNFLGRGQSLSFQLNSSDVSGESSLRFREPALLGRDLGYFLSLRYRTTDSFFASYNTEIASFSTGLDFPTGEFSRLAVRVGVESTDISVPTPAETAPYIRAEADRGRELAATVGYTFSYDTRGSGLNPDAGVFLSFGQDFAGLAGDATYVRTVAEASAETRLPRSDILLKATLEGGVIAGFDGYDTRVTDRFFTSSRTLRGFESRGIGPRQTNAADDYDDPLGGNAFAVLRLDATAPLPLPEEYGLSGGAFLDVGTVWSLDNAPAGVDDDPALRAAVGVSLIFDSPLGPLRFDFSTPLAKEDQDREQNFDFSIATSF